MFSGERTGGYRIGFRSSGTYSLRAASLISGGRHEVTGDHSFTTTMSAELQAAYNGKTYIGSVFGVSGLNYKDGDDFAFYLFPTAAYDSGEITLDERGTVNVTITKLYKNSWSKK
jgi:hypothetical protein